MPYPCAPLPFSPVPLDTHPLLLWDANEMISSLSISISLTSTVDIDELVTLGRTYADEEEEDAEHVEDRKQRQRKAGNDLISYYIYIYI